MNTLVAQTKTSHHAKPLRLVETKQMERDKWLAVRQSGIGGSDAAAAIGLNPYKSPLALWMEKTGRGEMLPQIDIEDDTQPVYWGSILEPIVAKHYSKRTGNKVRRVNAVLQHPTIPFMLANLDREIVGNTDVQILECKTAGMNGAKLWKDGIPDYVQVQVMHQLAVTGKQTADVAVLICGQDLQIHRIERDETMIENLIKLERQFWYYVENDIAPPADGSMSAEQALRCLFPNDDGEVVDLTADADLNHVFDDLQETRQLLKSIHADEAKMQQRLIQAIGTAAHARFRNGSISYKRSKDSMVLDSKRMAAENPDLALQYQILKAGNRRFLLSNKTA